LSGQSGFFSDARPPRSHPGPGTAPGRSATRPRTARRHRGGGVQPLPAAGGAAPHRSGGLPARGQRRALRAEDPAGGGPAGGCLPPPHPPARRPGGTAARTARGPAGGAAVNAPSPRGAALRAALGRVTGLLPARADLARMRHAPGRNLLAGLTVAVVALPLAL